jgi:hypothetical protein
MPYNIENSTEAMSNIVSPSMVYWFFELGKFITGNVNHMWCLVLLISFANMRKIIENNFKLRVVV